MNRDDLADGGASQWAETIREVNKHAPKTSVEALVGDFQGDYSALQVVIDAKPHILAHNLETVQRMHSAVRPQARYERSLEVLSYIQKAGLTSKTSIKVGIGETDAEVFATLSDIREQANTEILTIGQYLQPTRNHLPVDRWVHPDMFKAYKEEGLKLGFRVIESGPLVRSSFHAEEQVRQFETIQ